MNRIVFMVEEQSIKELLHELLPQILPDTVPFLVLAHQGKTDLERSIPRKLRAFPPEDRFVIVRDQDSADCLALKAQLIDLCTDVGRPDSLVRIVCRELESWFLGDLAAVGEAFGRPALSRRQDTAQYRNPDRLANASQQLKRLVPEFQQISGSRAIARCMDLNANRSHSFRVFVTGVRRVAGAMAD